MKLVIRTQYKENYGSHDWNGKGQCPQHWKFKGGDTYVVEGIQESHLVKLNMDGIPTLTNLIENADNFSSETIIDWEVVEDNEEVCEEWESPVILSYNKDNYMWVARQISDIEYMRDIDKKIASWTLLDGGERTDYKAEYRRIADGKWYTDKEIMEFREKEKKVA
jgi:hypothetical protein